MKPAIHMSIFVQWQWFSEIELKMRTACVRSQFTQRLFNERNGIAQIGTDAHMKKTNLRPPRASQFHFSQLEMKRCDAVNAGVMNEKSINDTLR